VKHFLPKHFNWTIVLAILLGVGLLGNVWYTDYRYDGVAENIQKENQTLNKGIVTLDGKIRDLAMLFEGTLSAEQKNNSDLREELEDITDAMDILERVSTTDRDLLRKYSKVYFLNENYVPLSLKTIAAKYRSSGATNIQILADVWPRLEDMFEDAEDDGLKLLALSAYRSYATQTALKSAYTVTYGSGANTFSADQGYSEHQLGTTVDFTTGNTGGALNGFDKTPEYAWLLENAYKYGFILSYPAGNAYYKFEPWHWRYVGRDLAEKLHDENMNFYDMDQRVIDSFLTKIFD
jgi:LAS superfamily LD-carboxypeptidase LdcB